MKFRVKKSTSKQTPHYYIQQSDEGRSWIGMQTGLWERMFPGRPWIESHSAPMRNFDEVSTQTKEDLKATVRELNERLANVKFEDTYREAVTA